MAAKTLTGKVVSTGMTGVIIVEVTRKTPHPLYKKLLKRSKKFKVALNGQEATVGDTVTMIETRPTSKDTHFALMAQEKKQVKTPAKAVETKEVKVEAEVATASKPKTTKKKEAKA